MALVFFASARGIVAQPASESASTPLTLAELERLALAASPSVAQAEALRRAEEGHRRQAGAFPNPTVGYRSHAIRPGDYEYNRRAAGQFGFIEQPIVLLPKLSRAKSAATQAVAGADAALRAQRQRVLNAVRIQYYDTLVDARTVEIRRRLAQLAREAVGISEELYNVGQADRPDVLQVEIEAEKAATELVSAEHDLQAGYEWLASTIGDTSVLSRHVDGDLEAGLPDLDLERLWTTLQAESPELQGAEAAAAREQALAAQARLERIPDLTLGVEVGHDNDISHGLGGWQGGLEVAVRLPLFDRRAGAVAAATAEADRRRFERDARKLALRAALAGEFHAYAAARERADRYRTEVVPRAEKAHALYLARFREMAAAYPQVLIARRAWFDAQREYVEALGDAWRHAVLLQGQMLGTGKED
jgi:cobalt-zinc-cadmium efflux system outer membrane protein